MKTKKKKSRKNLLRVNLANYTQKFGPLRCVTSLKGESDSPKPTTLLDVWGTDVERVILEDGRDHYLKYVKGVPFSDTVEFSPNGDWWRSKLVRDEDQGVEWKKSADTRVAYVFPVDYKKQVGSSRLFDTPKGRIYDGDALGSSCAEEAAKKLKQADIDMANAIRDVAYHQMTAKMAEQSSQPPPKPSLSVRLDNWLKKLLSRGA